MPFALECVDGAVLEDLEDEGVDRPQPRRPLLHPDAVEHLPMAPPTFLAFAFMGTK